MPAGPSDHQSWRRLVLDAMPRPAWLTEPGQYTDLVVSTRVRLLRNLKGHRFPHRCDFEELRTILAKVVEAKPKAGVVPLEFQSALSPAERDFLVACRMVSADFAWNEPGRGLATDAARKLSLMVNEEDHLRLQAVTAGWSPSRAEALAGEVLSDLAERLPFAWSPHFGFLAASPYNCGPGVRVSALFHLIGIAHAKRLSHVLSALAARKIVARGLYGEASRPLGALVQVSVTSGPMEDFLGAGAYLLDEERQARREVGKEVLGAKTRDALKLVSLSRALSLPDALRVLAWLRWAAAEKIEEVAAEPRQVDSWFTTLILRTTGDEERAARLRADYLRSELNL
ncbi:MAG: hypothetical protein HZC36_01610 [Armatimonadetes bacterium]|nr:hypothetical protein [Armatimonadota bacterium]